MPAGRLARFAWAVLAYNVAVVAFGAVVRATGSGAGCGSHWPRCNGAVVPLGGRAETFIEFTHRATSGIALVAVGLLMLAAFRRRPAGHPVRKAAVAAGVFVVGEALIGAALVLFEWVADDTSAARAVSMAAHLVNTFLLLGALALTAWWADGHPVPRGRAAPGSLRAVRVGAAALLLVGMAGAVTALGDTLFPPGSVAEGLGRDLGGTIIERLRIVHPVAAVATALYLLGATRLLGASGPTASRAGHALSVVLVVQLMAGVVNIALLAPIWMQVVHLLLADTVWVIFVVLAAEALAVPARRPLDMVDA